MPELAYTYESTALNVFDGVNYGFKGRNDKISNGLEDVRCIVMLALFYRAPLIWPADLSCLVKTPTSFYTLFDATYDKLICIGT